MQRLVVIVYLTFLVILYMPGHNNNGLPGKEHEEPPEECQPQYLHAAPKYKRIDLGMVVTPCYHFGHLVNNVFNNIAWHDGKF